ncbi:hypothetical protein THIOKS11520006 [Thiocapsa sp. KS1]|nr:hypothetical protein [Thiocapsa sp. KS1]CRI63750.1 hypothetical protein THIOKS11520006 [Thiocapsa sp. KS1]
MNAVDITARPGQAFILECLEDATTAALDARSLAMLAFVQRGLQSYQQRLNDAEKVRAAAILARVEAGLRWLGDRHA